MFSMGTWKFHAHRSNGFRENGRQSWNILRNAHYSNRSQSANIGCSDLAEEHI